MITLALSVNWPINMILEFHLKVMFRYLSFSRWDWHSRCMKENKFPVIVSSDLQWNIACFKKEGVNVSECVFVDGKKTYVGVADCMKFIQDYESGYNTTLTTNIHMHM